MTIHDFTRSLEASTGPPGLAEGKRVRLGARIGDCNLEGAVGDGAGRPDELVQPWPGHHAVALLVGVGPVCRARRRTVEQDTESHGRSVKENFNYSELPECLPFAYVRARIPVGTGAC